MTRNTGFAVAVAMALLAAPLASACGPSSSQVAQAHEARYQATRDEVLLAVTDALAQEELPVERSDPDQGAVLTSGRWFEKDGTHEDKAFDQTGKVMTHDGSVYLAYLVKVVGAAPPYRVEIEPWVEQVRAGYSARYHIEPGNPQMPGWVAGKVDILAVQLHGRLKGKFISPPGVVAGS